MFPKTSPIWFGCDDGDGVGDGIGVLEIVIGKCVGVGVVVVGLGEGDAVGDGVESVLILFVGLVVGVLE